ncbi:MAG: M23 family metallopeptidase [Candidatus Neomarinimicrobiota bacterium]
MVNNKSRKNSGRSNYILIAQNDFEAQQWQFTRRKAVATAALAVVLSASTLFFGADLFTKLIYQNKLREMQSHYQSMNNTVVDLRSQLDKLDQYVGDLENKDRAMRTYADLPQIDDDVRQLGIGGVYLSKDRFANELMPEVESSLAEIEMDIQHLTRKVQLELSSFSTIYDKMVQDSEQMVSIPSIRPMDAGYYSSGFGFRKDPFDGEFRFHQGQDISARTGTAVYAPADGVVLETRYNGGFGKVIKISHGHGYVTYFGHLNEFNVSKGEKVKRGQLVGKVGNTGRSTGPHLHYEVHYYNTPQNPLDYFFSGYLH